MLPNDSGFPDDTYISLGISRDADAIVLQSVIPGSHRPFTAFPISLAELDSLGSNDAVGKIGRMTLDIMTAYYTAIKHCAAALRSLPINAIQAGYLSPTMGAHPTHPGAANAAY